MSKIRVVHYINQFFANIGGEEKADYPAELRVGEVVGRGERPAAVGVHEEGVVLRVVVVVDGGDVERHPPERLDERGLAEVEGDDRLEELGVVVDADLVVVERAQPAERRHVHPHARRRPVEALDWRRRGGDEEMDRFVGRGGSSVAPRGVVG